MISNKTALSAALFLAPAMLNAASLTWDDAHATNTWNTTNTNWVGGAAWSNATPDSAIFGGTGEDVTLGENITAAGITVSSSGYTFTGSTLTLSNGGAGINVATGTSATIASGFTSAGTIQKTGAGTLVLTNTVGFANIFRINIVEGVVSIRSNSFNYFTPNSTVDIQSGAVLSLDNTTNNAHQLAVLTLNSGTLTSASPVANDGTFGNMIIHSAVNVGGSALSTISTPTFNVQNAGTNFSVADSVSGTGTDFLISSVLGGVGGINKTGAGTMLLTGQNTISGGITVTTGRITTGNAAALGESNVTLAGGTLQVGDGTVNSLTIASAKNITTTAATTIVLGAGTSRIALSGGGKYDFSGDVVTFDLGNFFNADGVHQLISGGTGNVDAASYVFVNTDSSIFRYSFADGVLTVVPEPSTYGLLAAGSLMVAAGIARRRKSR